MSVRLRLITAFAALASCLLALAAGSAVAATPGEVTHYKVGACSRFGVGEIAAAPGEGVLLRTCGANASSGSMLVTVLPSGEIVPRALPASGPGPLVAGPAGEIWSVRTGEESPGGAGADLSVDRIDAIGVVANFPLGSAKLVSYERRQLTAYGLVPDGQGGLWVALGELGQAWNGNFFNSTGGELVHLAADGAATRFPVPGDVEPGGLVLGPDGNLWFPGVSGRFSTEHSESAGKGFIGRMTPTGTFAVFRIPAGEELVPGGIAAGPDGRLWFVEATFRVQQFGTIDVDGTFGPVHRVHTGLWSAMTFGPEGDPWFTSGGGLGRMTPTGQVTVYPTRLHAVSPQVVTGSEGAIWSLDEGVLTRVVPGGPGIDIQTAAADRRARTITLTLACGGPPTAACDGTVELALDVVKSRRTKPSRQGTKIRFAKVAYSVPGESAAKRTVAVPPRIFELARRYNPPHSGLGAPPLLIAHATVAGGPTLDADLRVPSLAPNR